MEKSIRKDDMLHALIDAKADWVLAPNAFPSGSPKASAARHHGDVDSDWARLEATLGRMTGKVIGRQYFRVTGKVYTGHISLLHVTE